MSSPKASERTDHSQLPAVKELRIILEKEAKRPVPPDKENTHYASFNSVITWLKELGLDGEVFSQPLTGDWAEVLAFGEQLSSRVVEKTLEINRQTIGQLARVISDVTAYLGEVDQVQNANTIFVFGSPSLLRIERAVELWQEGLAPKIFVSGGNPIYKPGEKSEAAKYQEYALSRGVPAKVMDFHDGAISVADNVRGGLNRMDELGLSYSKMILVTSWFAQRRSWATMMKYVPEETRLYRVNSSSNLTGGLTEQDWWKNERGIRMIFNEYLKMKVSETLNSS